MAASDPGPPGQPYRRSAAIYDALYGSLADERTGLADLSHRLIQEHGTSGGRRLLDVACGTGWYLPLWRRHYEVEGVDLSPDMLGVARGRAPAVPLHVGDMTTFDLGRRFDAVVCLGSSIGYARTPDRLDRAVATFARHTAPGGVIVVHGWVTPDRWRGGELRAELVDKDDLKVARLTRSSREGDVSILEMHHLVVTADASDCFVERHEMGLFAPERYCAAFERAGLAVVAHDPEAGRGRGVYAGVRT
ncbi:MAG TPA: class I SAM-dependent methyltransferase [Chloroflexota bacterium]|nr:class I SAM-dependent methyltransferase [Chloroflexota bacterium]